MLRVEGAAKQDRPDLGDTLLSKKILQVRYAIDEGLTAPFEAGIAIPQSLLICAVAKQQSKSNMYREACRVKNCVFVPFIMYTTGKIHDQGLSFLK